MKGACGLWSSEIGAWELAGRGQFLVVIPSPGLPCCVTLTHQHVLSGPLSPLPCLNG